ncbi:hypothetical protein WQ54_19400 [Bacillus sp. SA1-12]|uniref:hypothetical protein n=1 Tax=Bacillus sp. SA1-12 TaxID=1455638 RepID=UPI00062712E3|nr:hypothetical protein [Bacillus sp. SA1-12]KKI90687.1 hypothetical protein WQ54_19400 [Bacillus sp. SA1-12]
MIPPQEYVRKSLFFTRNDFGKVEVIPKSKWLSHRYEADIIPPSVSNIQIHLSWVDTMLRVYESKVSDLDALVIIGSSYWEVDRPEIDFFLENLPKKATVYIGNLEPDRELIKKIKSLGFSYNLFGFDELPWKNIKTSFYYE